MEQPRLVLRSKPPDGNNNIRQLRAEPPEALPRTLPLPGLPSTRRKAWTGSAHAPVTLQHFGPPLPGGDYEVIAGPLGQSPLPLRPKHGLPGTELGLLIQVQGRAFVHDDAFTSQR